MWVVCWEVGTATHDSSAATVAPALGFPYSVGLEGVREHDAIFASEGAVAFNLVLASDEDGRDGAAE